MKWSDLLFIDKVDSNRKEFGEKLIDISGRMGINPDWLMAVMNSESGLNPKAKNPYGGATGLIQFMPNTAKGLGTTTTALYNMSNVDQLDYVYEFYKPYSSYITKFHHLYLATFYPRALVKGYGKDYVFGNEVDQSRVSIIGEQNPGIDKNKDGTVTMSEFKEFALKKVPEPYRTEFRKESADSIFKLAGRNKLEIIVGLLLIVMASLVGYKAFSE